MGLNYMSFEFMGKKNKNNNNNNKIRVRSKFFCGKCHYATNVVARSRSQKISVRASLSHTDTAKSHSFLSLRLSLSHSQSGTAHILL